MPRFLSPCPLLLAIVLLLVGAAGCAGGGGTGSVPNDGAGGEGSALAGADLRGSGEENRGARSGARPGGGRIVDGPANIRAFSPRSTATAVDATTVDLRRVFEDLGPDASLWYQHVQTLSDPYFEGRASGTDGFRRATAYLEFHLREIGLAPAFPDPRARGAPVPRTRYDQPFTFRGRGLRRIATQNASLAVDEEAFEHGKAFRLLAGAEGGVPVRGPVTFVGYGIEAGEDGYTSFDDDTDLAGRVALLLRYEPLDESGVSRWAERRFSRHAGLERKLRAVADRGAAAIVLVTPPGAVDGRSRLARDGDAAGYDRPLGIPVVHVTVPVAESILARSDPRSRGLTAWRRDADTGAVRCRDLSPAVLVSVAGVVDPFGDQALKPSANVGGILRGSGDLADEWIVVGGHYDHLGHGEAGFLGSHARGELHPGADDNASGTAGVLITARRLAAWYARIGAEADRRSILFIGFGAEEEGLFGSAHFVDAQVIPPPRTVLMVNMDMIGRLRGDDLMIGGTGTALEFDEMLSRLVAPTGLTISAIPAGRGPSDHSNFYGAEIPVLFFFTGLHREYHAPGDLGHTVNPAGAMKVLGLVEAIVRETAVRPGPLTFRPSGGRTLTPKRRDEND